MKKTIAFLLLLQTAFLLSCTTDADDEWDAAKVCPESKRGTFVDERDGQVYKYTTIGDQVWMAQNLNYETGGSVCNYKTEGCSDKGLLYYADVAEKSCPDGWHVPSKDEWHVLFKNVGGVDVSSVRLKNTSGWIPLNRGDEANGTDDCGFSILPFKINADRDGLETQFISSSRTENSSSDVEVFIFRSYENQVVGTSGLIRYSLSYVRCVKD